MQSGFCQEQTLFFGTLYFRIAENAGSQKRYRNIFDPEFSVSGRGETDRCSGNVRCHTGVDHCDRLPVIGEDGRIAVGVVKRKMMLQNGFLMFKPNGIKIIVR